MAKKKETSKTKTKSKSKQNGQPANVNQFGHLQSLFDALPQNVYQKDAEGRVIFCNKSLLANLGKTPDELYGKTDYDLYPKEFADKYAADDKKVLETGEAIDVIEENESPVTGEVSYVHVVKTPVRNDAGEIIGTQGIWWDVTDRINAENEVRESQVFSQTILESMATPLIITRVEDNVILYANIHFAELMGLSHEELVGSQAPNFYHNEMMQDHIVQRVQTQGDVTDMETQLKRADGELFWGMISVRAFEFGHSPAVMTMMSDITERKQVFQAYEDALEATEVQAHRLSLLNEFGADLNSAVTVNDVYRTTARHLPKIVPNDSASVGILNQEGDKYTLINLREDIEDAYYWDAENTAMHFAVREMRMIRLPKDVPMENYLDGKARLKAGLNSTVCSPLIVQGKAIGSINIAWKDAQGFQDIDAGFVLQISSLVANAIESRRLDEQSRLLASIVENHPDFIGVGSLMGQALYVNPAGRRMIGLPIDFDITQMVTTDFYNEEDAKVLIDEAVPHALNHGVWQGETILRQSSGTELPVDQIININYNANNEPVSFAITMHDITERKMSELAIRESEEQLQSLIEFAPEAIVIVNTETGLFESPNTNAERLYGLDRKELVKVGPGQMSPEFQPDGSLSAESAGAQIMAAMQGKAPVFEWIHLNAQGDEIPCEVRLTQLPGSEHLVRASVTDITDRKLAERSLARRAAELQTVADVSTAVASTLDTIQLLQEVVDLTKTSFGLYHAHIYILNETKDTLMLTAGAGEAGARMVAEKRSIPLSQEQSLVARTARNREGIIVNDVYADTGFLPHPALPDTRSEMAVPIIATDQLLGVLDIQSDQVDRFTEQDLVVQGTLASQIGIALNNARTFEESEKAREQLNVLTRRLTREGWENYMDSLTTDLSYSYGDVADAQNGEISEAEVSSNLVQSLDIQGESIGELALSLPAGSFDEASQIVAAVANNLSAHLENLRLTEQTQVALSETESLYNTSTRLNASTNLEQILESAFELPKAVGAFSGALYTFNLADNGLPEWADVVSTIGDSPVQKGNRVYIPDFALANMWLSDPKGAVLINDVSKSGALDKKSKAVFKEEDTGALVILPLTVGTRKIGQAVFRWAEPRAFSGADQRIFNAIATQSASIVYNRLLFRQTDEALSETAALYQGSADLNTANTYDDVLKALRHHTLLGQNSSTISIQYFNQAWTENVPEWVDVLSFWSRVEPEEAPTLRFALADYPSIKTLLSATKPTIIEDVVHDKSIGKNLKRLYRKQFKAKSVVFIPLVIGGQWVGFLNATYTKQVSFPDQEIRRTLALSRQSAVAIENVRLFVQTQANLANLTTIQETTSQLTASNTFNDAVRALLPQLVKAATSDLVRMFVVKDDQAICVGTFPESGQLNETMVIPLQKFPVLKVVADKGTTNLVSADDPNLTKIEQKVFKDSGVNKMVAVPLVTQGGVFGFFTVSSRDTSRIYTDQEINLLQTLADQATIAFERVRLLDETTKRAQREQALRQISAKVRGSADVDVVLRTAVEEVGKMLGRQAYVYLQDEEETA